MPLVGYLFVAAEPIIRLALGPQWMPAAQLFAILAFAAFLQTPSGFRGTVLMSLGLGQRYFRQGLITAIITCAGFAIGIRWGATGVATAYAVTSLILPYPMHVYSFRGTPVSPRDFLGSIAGPAIAAVAAGAICLVLRFHYWQAAPAAVDALASLLAYGTLYVGLLLLRAENRRSLQRARVFLRNARQKRKESIAVPPTTAPAAVVTAPTK
jgi:O-antigen/teichoic acid export membrane protein